MSREFAVENRSTGYRDRLSSPWAPVVLLTAFFWGIAKATAWAAYATTDLVTLLVIYGLLACALHFASLTLTRAWVPLGALAAGGVAAIVLWHFREQTGSLGLRPLQFMALSIALASCYFPLLLRSRRSATPGLLAATAMLSAAMLTGVLASAFLGSNALRWQLLRQNKLIGTAAYFVWGQSVKVLRGEEPSSHAVEPVEPRPQEELGTLEAESRNIVFILIDTLRADSLAAYGGRSDLMPNLNQFADESIVFGDVLANATWTRPSVASFFTGLRQEEHGAADRGDRLPEKRITLAESLGRMGYETAAFVTNFAAVGRDAGFAQGFDYFAELAGGNQPYLRAGEVDEVVLEWLARRELAGRTKPIFLYIHYLDPHPPYLSETVDDTASLGEARKAYNAELRYLDDELWSLLSVLRRRLPRDTAYLVTADHGEEFGEHGEGGHGHSLYSEVANLPAILNFEGLSGRSDAKLEARDFFELILRLADRRETDPTVWAASRSRRTRYTSVQSATSSSWHRPYQTYVWLRGLEEDGYFLIWSAYGPTYELYDVTADRRELHNLADQESERAHRMMRRMNTAAPRWSPRVPVEHSEETTALLRTLGYIE